MKFRPTILVIMAVALTGCVTGRRTFELPVKTAAEPVAHLGDVYIASVTDDRQFQNKPSDPSIPSINGDVATLSAEQRDRMIGRQRNTWGGAMGDVSLPENDTVTRRVRLLVEQGLLRSGYRVSAGPGAPNSVTVSVQEFWGWMTPGLFTISFEAKITCAVTTSAPGGSHTVVVKGYGKKKGQIASNENWQRAFAPAFDDFIANFAAQSANLQLRRNDSAETHAAATP